MTDNEALDILRAQGHAAATPDRNGLVRGAEGKLSFDEIRERREDEALIKR